MIRLEAIENFPIVAVLGKLDFSDVDLFEEALDVLDAERIVIVSFELATFVDSNALGMLVRRQSARKGQVVVIVPVGSVISRAFDLAGVRTILHIAADRDGARDMARNLRDMPAASFSRDGVVDAAKPDDLGAPAG